jgi:uncharacterized protein
VVRLSSYAILSTPLPGGGYALLNGCTGAIDVISNELGAILAKALQQSHSDPSLQQASRIRYKHDVVIPMERLPEELADHLIERGHLTRVPHEVERAHVGQLANLMHELARIQPAILIVPSFDCNYRCPYCFERPIQRRLGSPKADIAYEKGTVLMGREHVDPLYAAIERIEHEARERAIWDDLREAGRLPEDDRGSRPAGITLYGGEPLNAANREIVFEIVEHGVARGHPFAAVTNGHDLDVFLPLLAPDMISQLQISIDGPKHLHDRSRIARNRESSFDKIVTNIGKVLARGGVEIQLRCHVDPRNVDQLQGLVDFFEEQRWLDHSDVVIYLSNYNVKDEEGRVSRAIDYDEVLKRWADWAGRYGNVFVGSLAAHTDALLAPALEEGEPARLRGTYCAANSGAFIFAPDGFVYCCWESVGKECSRVGRYMGKEGLSLDPKLAKHWFERSLARIPECLDCCFALVCGGGCAQYAEYNTGSLYKPYCNEFEVVYPAALAKTVARRFCAERDAMQEDSQSSAAEPVLETA